MLSINIISTLLLLGFPIYGSRRGTGPVVLSAILIAVGGLIAVLFAPVLANSLPLVHRPTPEASIGVWRLIIAVPLAIAAFPFANYLNRFYPFSFDPFELALGFILGVVAAFFIVQFLLSSLLMAYTGLPQQAELQQQFIVRQTVYLEGWHNFIEVVNPPVDPPTVPE